MRRPEAKAQQRVVQECSDWAQCECALVLATCIFESCCELARPGVFKVAGLYGRECQVAR